MGREERGDKERSPLTFRGSPSPHPEETEEEGRDLGHLYWPVHHPFDSVTLRILLQWMSWNPIRQLGAPLFREVGIFVLDADSS